MADDRCKIEQECTHEPWCRINGKCHRASVPEVKSTMHDDYKVLDTPQGVTLDRCPICASEAALWQYSESETSPRKLVVMCSHGERIGPQDGLVNEGCPFYMPRDGHYRETIRDAIRYWNELAKAITARRASHASGVQTCRLCRGQGRAGSDTCPACNGTSIDALGVDSTSRPDPKKCNAMVDCTHGIVTTKSCTTGRPLIDKGGSPDGERDYYECPDCGKQITVDYREK